LKRDGHLETNIKESDMDKLEKIAQMYGTEFTYDNIIKPNVKYLDTQFSESNGWHLYSDDDVIDENFLYLVATAEEGGIMQNVVSRKNGKWVLDDEENKNILYYKKLYFYFE
jgi:hypothetical protein